MKVVDRLDWEKVRDIWELSTRKSLEIYTAIEAKPNAECDWFYQIECDDYAEKFGFDDEDSGFLTYCSCLECKNLGVDLFEYFSIYEALSWVKYYVPQITVNLWVTSKKFLFEAEEELLTFNAERYTCSFLKNLCNELQGLLFELDVRIAHPTNEVIACIRHYRN
jgi:hypothetical protein